MKVIGNWLTKNTLLHVFPTVFPAFSTLGRTALPSSHLLYLPHRKIRCRKRRRRLPLPAVELEVGDISVGRLGSNQRRGRKSGSLALRTHHRNIQDAYPHHAARGTQLYLLKINNSRLNSEGANVPARAPPAIDATR